MKTSVSLLERLRQPHEDQAWTRFVNLYVPLLLFWARRLGCQEAEAADLVQEVLTLLIRKLPEFTYDRHKTFRGWLRTVARNCWQNQRRRAALPYEPAGADLAEIPAAQDDDPFWEVEYRNRLVARALELMQTPFQPTTWKACWETIVHEKPPPRWPKNSASRSAPSTWPNHTC